MAVSKFLYLHQKRLRILLGASLGSIYSLYIFVPEPDLFFSILVKILMAVSIISVTFGVKWQSFFRSFICFCFMNFLFSGLNFLMWITFKPKGMVVSNGVVYFNISPLVLVISTIVAYFIIELINKFLGKHICKDEFFNVEIIINTKIISFDAFLDTGNSLKEPFSNLPVILVRKKDLENLIPNFDIEDDNLISDLFKKLNIKFRLIPFFGMSYNGIILGFKPDKTVIKSSSGEVFNKDAYIGICCDENFEHPLIGPDILDK